MGDFGGGEKHEGGNLQFSSNSEIGKPQEQRWVLNKFWHSSIDTLALKNSFAINNHFKRSSFKMVNEFS